MYTIVLVLAGYLCVHDLAPIQLPPPKPNPKPSTTSKPAPSSKPRPPSQSDRDTEESAKSRRPFATLLVTVDEACDVYIDGEKQPSFAAGEARRISVDKGQHLVRAVAADAEWKQIVDVKESGQLVVSTDLRGARAGGRAAAATRLTEPASGEGSSGTTDSIGMEFEVRLLTEVSSARATIGDRIEAVTVGEARQERWGVSVPAGTVVSGYIADATQPAATKGGTLLLSWDQITVGSPIAVSGRTKGVLPSDANPPPDREPASATIDAILGRRLGRPPDLSVDSDGRLVSAHGDVIIRAGTILRVVIR